MEAPSRAAEFEVDGSSSPREPQVRRQLQGGAGRQYTAANAEFQTESSVPMEWTDEKHSLYLKSMEASFISQLYGSMNILSEHFKNEKTPDGQSSQFDINANSSSGQFKVQRDGCWKKLSFKKPGSEHDKGDDDSYGFLTSPWIQHFRPVPKSGGGGVTEMDAISGLPITNLDPVRHCRSQLRHQVVGSNTEVSDQNFADEDEENRIGTCRARETDILTASSNDQVVPYGSSSLTRDVERNLRI